MKNGQKAGSAFQKQESDMFAWPFSWIFSSPILLCTKLFSFDGQKTVFGEMKYYFMLFEINKMILVKRDRYG
jgi:hypothetical protein